jgi:hypothetical protein
MKAGLAESGASVLATPGKMRVPLWLKLDGRNETKAHCASASSMFS